MLRTIVLTAALGLAAAAAVPADAAVKLYCVSAGYECASWSCPSGYHAVVDTGGYPGPWVVVCAPNV